MRRKWKNFTFTAEQREAMNDEFWSYDDLELPKYLKKQVFKFLDNRADTGFTLHGETAQPANLADDIEDFIQHITKT